MTPMTGISTASIDAADSPAPDARRSFGYRRGRLRSIQHRATKDSTPPALIPRGAPPMVRAAMPRDKARSRSMGRFQSRCAKMTYPRRSCTGLEQQCELTTL